MTTKILFVDDEPIEKIVRPSFRKQINNGIYELTFARDGQSALDIIRNQTLDIVLVDINMPGMDGLELLSLVKETQPWLASIIMSGYYGDVDNIRGAMRLGAFDFIPKPIDFTDLGKTINAAIEHARKQKYLITTSLIHELHKIAETCKQEFTQDNPPIKLVKLEQLLNHATQHQIYLKN